MLYSSHIGKPVELPLDGAAFEQELKKRIETSTYVKVVEEAVEGDLDKSFT
jgi:hypothetical protein